jgi:hypothetical protein
LGVEVAVVAVVSRDSSTSMSPPVRSTTAVPCIPRFGSVTVSLKCW